MVSREILMWELIEADDDEFLLRIGNNVSPGEKDDAQQQSTNGAQETCLWIGGKKGDS